MEVLFIEIELCMDPWCGMNVFSGEIPMTLRVSSPSRGCCCVISPTPYLQVKTLSRLCLGDRGVHHRHPPGGVIMELWFLSVPSCWHRQTWFCTSTHRVVFHVLRNLEFSYGCTLLMNCVTTDNKLQSKHGCPFICESYKTQGCCMSTSAL
jgi:hypothetical protein